MSRPTAEALIDGADRISTLCRNVFSTTEGRELIQELRKVYAEGKLYCDNDRDTVYYIAQRDLILELESHSNRTAGGELPNGEDIS